MTAAWEKLKDARTDALVRTRAVIDDVTAQVAQLEEIANRLDEMTFTQEAEDTRELADRLRGVLA